MVPAKPSLRAVLTRALGAGAVASVAVFVVLGEPGGAGAEGGWLALAGRVGFTVTLAATGHALLSRR